MNHNIVLFSNFLRHEKLIFSESKKPMEFDILIPKLNLAIEYYGEQHYLFHFLQGDPEEQQRRDSEKRIKCAEEGITLIEIPYWWDRNSSKLINSYLFLSIIESLLATIHQIRPDIIPENMVPQGAKPIPATNKKKEISKIKKSNSSSFDFMLPIQWNPKIQPNGWYRVFFYFFYKILD